MAPHIRFMTLDCADPTLLAQFWAAVLDWTIAAAEDWGAVVQGAEPTAPGIFFQPVPETKTTKNRMHLDVWTDNYTAEVDRVVGLGATEQSRGITADGRSFSVLLDPEGNEFCLAAST